ncbi:hypothetical protein [Pelagibius sp. Alg239-R121]|uniref:hypothetical protein n=1 Tax=Pelagibius sp. Alg239-R121 TaxID=2993448 RepID=UPI0024A77321|nr:hypothetical protein [Pelagibius sp. Alg239-R121]
MQTLVLAVTLALMILLAFVFYRVVRATNADRQLGDTNSRRSQLIWVMLAVGLLVTVASLREWPHALASGDAAIQVNATGGQWYWEIDRSELPAGKPIVFNLHTEDVNHGFGVVDSEGRLLFQTQAMPGYVNQVEYVFDTPGDYRVLCMEFCGVGHHDMLDEFTVVAN